MAGLRVHVILILPIDYSAFPQDISARRGVCAQRALCHLGQPVPEFRSVFVSRRGPGARIHRDRHAGPAHPGFQETGHLANPPGELPPGGFPAPQGFRHHRLPPRGRLRRGRHLRRVVGGYHRLGRVYRRPSPVLHSRVQSGRRAARQGRGKTRDHRRPAEFESFSDRGRR